jgi:hypothetical protein
VGGYVVGVIGVGQDITERKVAKQEKARVTTKGAAEEKGLRQRLLTQRLLHPEARSRSVRARTAARCTRDALTLGC